MPAPTKGYGFHPLGAWLGGTRECLALSRPRDLESAVETLLHSNRKRDAIVQSWVPEALLGNDGWSCALAAQAVEHPPWPRRDRSRPRT
jgi:hypothetical protein